MSHPPRVTVLLPVYNGADFLRPAIDSILAQSVSDFELLVIDDGSTDGSREIVGACGDSRIRLIENGRNLGLIATLNRGLDLARGEFIARMDADDFSQPERFARQLAYLDAHPNIGGCGTWFEKCSDQGGVTMRMPETPGLIRLFLVFDNPFLHSSMMLRRRLLDEHGLRYDPAYPHTEDYDLWVRCSERMDLANVPAVLMRYRDHPGNVSHRYGHEQDTAAGRVRARQLRQLGLSPTAAELALHLDLVECQLGGGLDRLAAARDWLTKVLTAGCQRHGVRAAEIYPYLGRYWYGACGRSAQLGWSAWQLFRSSPVGRAAAWEWQWKLFLRCTLRRGIPGTAATGSGA